MRLFDLLLVQYLILTVLFGIVVYAHHNYVLNTEEQTELAWQQEAQERGWDAIVTFYYWIDLRQMLIRNLANSIETKDLESSFVTLANKYLTIDDSNASLNMKFYLYNNQQLTSAKTSENKAIEKAEFDSVFEDFKGADFTTIIENGGVNQILIGYQVPSTTAWAFTVAPISDIFYSISQFSLPPGIKLKVSHKNNNISYNEASTNPQWSFTVEEVVGNIDLSFKFSIEHEFIDRFHSKAFGYFKYLGFISIICIYLFSLILVNKIKLQQKEIKRRQKAEYQLDAINKNLENLVESRTAELQKANEELHATMSKLAEAQKLAALGNLVSAIAHKLNTPLGTTITALSHIEHEESSLRIKLESQKLVKQDLLNFLEQAEQATQIAMNNTSRAAELVQNFKQLAKVQEKVPKEAFELTQLLNESIIEAKQKCGENIEWRKGKFSRKVSCTGYPLLLQESLVSIIHNAWLHGLKLGEGIINCDIAITNDKEITIIIENSGKPIAEESQARIFEPFYTDRLTEDCTGLGLYIVHNIVVNQMNGHIIVAKSELGGARFEITFPRDIF